MELNERQLQTMKAIFAQNSVVVAYLFGSLARGTAAAHSDVDIAILYENSLTSREHLAGESILAQEFEKVLGRQVDVINLAQAKSPLLKHRAVLRGRLLYCSNTKQRQQLETNIFREYNDTEFLRALHGQILRRHSKEGSFGIV